MKMVFTEMKHHEEIILSAFPEDEIIIRKNAVGPDELVNLAKGAEVLSVFIYTSVPRKVIENLPDLKLIVTRSVGFDHIDAGFALERGIEVCHIPDYGSHVVAEHAFALLLGCVRNLVRADNFVKSGRIFSFEPFLGTELRGKTLGVIGTGKIGAEVIAMASGFGMRILAYDIYRNNALAEKYAFEYVDLDRLLAESDFVTLHMPLTPQNHHIINEETLSKMKNGAILINTARGGLVDTAALKKALESGHLAAAGLDVIEHESDGDLGPMLSAPNLTVTPHSAFYTREALERITRTTVKIISEYKKGEIINRIPREYL